MTAQRAPLSPVRFGLIREGGRFTYRGTLCERMPGAFYANTRALDRVKAEGGPVGVGWPLSVSVLVIPTSASDCKRAAGSPRQ